MSSCIGVSSWTTPLSSLLVLSAPTFAGNVLVVDAGGGGAFTEIQAAIDAALDGDTILVKTGTYVSFAVADKSVAIVGDTGHDVRISGVMRVHDLAAGKTMLLENLDTASVPGGTGSRAVFLANDAGSVRIESCTLVGADGTVPLHRSGWEAAFVESCADVSFTHCTVRGGVNRPGDVYGGPGELPGHAGEGLSINGSTVVVHDCTISGQDGQNGGVGGVDGGWGGRACRLAGGKLLASACSFVGGDGGSGDTVNCGTYNIGGVAGHALHLVGPASLARIQGCIEVGGTPGCDIGGFCIPHCFPQYPARFGSTFVDLPSPTRRLYAPTPVRESTPGYLGFRGQAGDHAYVLLSATTLSRFVPQWEGSVLVRPRLLPLMLFAGTIPASGVLTTPMPDHQLPFGVESGRYYMQAVMVDTQGVTRLGGPSSLVILDDSF